MSSDKFVNFGGEGELTCGTFGGIYDFEVGILSWREGGNPSDVSDRLDRLDRLDGADESI